MKKGISKTLNIGLLLSSPLMAEVRSFIPTAHSMERCYCELSSMQSTERCSVANLAQAEFAEYVVGRLQPAKQQIVRMHFFESMSAAAIARTLHKSVSSVELSLRRAVMDMRGIATKEELAVVPARVHVLATRSARRKAGARWGNPPRTNTVAVNSSNPQ